MGAARPTRLLAALFAVLGAAVATDAQSGRPGAETRVVINEILASNRSTNRDPQRQYDDWIELYNPTNVSADVAGMYLTDDSSTPTKWQFPVGSPSTTIAPHGYLLIWADGDTASTGLHASFRLEADGEEVVLVASDGTTRIDSLSFDQQRADVSYGRYPDGGPDLRFMAVPTPGEANVDAYEGIAETPQFSRRGCLFSEPLTVTLTTDTPGATIYYTTDGTDPFSVPRQRPGGSVYTGPIQVSRTMTIRAVAWLPGWRQSDVSSERFSFIGASLRSFRSPLPLMVVDTMGKAVSGTQTPVYGYVIDTDERGTATVTGQTDFAGRAGLNVRGKSSEGFPKQQYHFEVWDDQDRDRDASILGLPADADWVLQGPYSDKTLMRNVLVYRWSNEMGRYAPRTRFIELFLKTDNSDLSMNDYVGVYIFMEKIKIAPDRVDIAVLDSDDNAEPQITGGYIVKKDKLDGGDVTFRTSRGQELIYDDPIGTDMTQAQRDWIRDFLNAFEATLYGGNFKDPIDGYAAFIDVGAFIDHHILVETAKNIDGFRLSTYMFKDRDGKLHMGPVWDYNLSLGNADYLDGWIPSGWYNRLLGDGEYPWWRRLFEDSEFQLRYADRWFELRRGLFATERLLGMIDDYAALLKEPQARNFARWRILGQYVWPNPVNVDPAYAAITTYGGEVAWMKNWLEARLAWLDGQIAGEFASVPPAFNHQGGHVESGFVLEMTASSGTIYYTLDGSDPGSLNSSGAVQRTLLIPENAPKRVLVPTGPVDDAWRGGATFDDSAWTPATGSPGGVGFERSVGYEDFISLDVGASMYGRQSSCCIRIPFNFTEKADAFDTMTLRIRYDDGFVAYLNGTEIARRNVVGTPAWNANAADQNPDLNAMDFEEIEISGFAPLLRRVGNVLAIHGMNVSSTSSDFLISAELVATTVEQSEQVSTVERYAGPIGLAGSAHVKARAQVGNKWSALNSATFAVGPVAESLRISEIMYHPPETGSPDDPNLEYIELVSIGAESIDLNLVRFTDGVDFTFGSVVLAPGDRVLVVKDIEAFETRYGPGLPIAGEYTGSLNNAGETVELQDAAGQIIHSFAFEDDWYDATDGNGFSLTVADLANTDPQAWGDRQTWRPSAAVGGSPGYDDAGI
jgi:hypothetical protein